MINIQGKRNSALVFADRIDKETKTRLAELLRREAYADSRVRIMPDTHTSKGTVVGTAMTLHGRVSPMLIGVDIGCGMEAVWLDIEAPDLPKLDDVIRARIPSGSAIHESPIAAFDGVEGLICRDAVDLSRAARSLGTLGGGNHFIELDRTESGRYLLVIHSGSRALGSEVACHYRDLAYRYQCKKERKGRAHSPRDEEGGFTRSQRRESKTSLGVRPESAVLEGEQYEQYLLDVRTVTEFAAQNRRTIADLICDGMGWKITDRFSVPHNTIDDHRILRKGAISARMGERVLIPLNMRDGVILGSGLGNPDWNFSAPHGAGRACSRADAKRAYTIEQFGEAMQGIYTTTATPETIDECPMAYKSPDRILSYLAETVQVEQIAVPVYNYKDCRG